MYVTEYCDNPHNILLHCYSKQYDDSIVQECDIRQNEMDRFLYLVDGFMIIRDCAQDIQAISQCSEKEFWHVNKLLLNYLNSVYCYHEFVNAYNPSLKSIVEKYYKRQNGNRWYRFICEYRNRVVHRSSIIKDYSKDDAYLDLDELIKQENENIVSLSEDEEENGSKISNARRFKQMLEDLKRPSPEQNKRMSRLSLRFVDRSPGNMGLTSASAALLGCSMTSVPLSSLLICCTM